MFAFVFELFAFDGGINGCFVTRNKTGTEYITNSLCDNLYVI